MADFIDRDEIVGTAPASLENLEWIYGDISQATGQDVASAKLVDFSGMGGLNATMRRLVVTFKDGTEVKFVYKTMLPDAYAKSKDLGLPRESFFYKYLAPKLAAQGVPLANVVFVHGNMATGEKTMVLADLSAKCVQSGYFFGPGSPHNWNKDLSATIAANRPAHAPTNIGMADIARAAFRSAASMHATYWMDDSLLQYKWLRSGDWLQGQKRESWQAAQDYSSGHWATVREKIRSGASGVQWDPHLVACMDASMSKISWEEYQQRVHSAEYQWTLVHGDFHPANILWRWPEERFSGDSGALGSSVLLDFEVVGVGSGAQDLAQYLISHACRADRQQHEEALLRDYYEHLTGASQAGNRVDAAKYSYEQCRRDYVEGGVCRWVWLLALLAAMCPDPMTQYFHDQVRDFMVDHEVTPENIAMPRV